jgi:hypothetical protein
MVADTIQNVSASAQLIVTNSYPMFGTKNNVTGTSVLGFRLDNIMSDQVYFSVQSTATSISGFGGLITFDRVLINVGNAWSTVNNAFTALCAGIYFFSYAFAAAQPSTVGLAACVNGIQVGSINMNDNRNGILLGRSSSMLQLSANDVVNFKSYNTLTSSTDGLINAQGFYYSPLGGAAAAVAWAVSFTTSGSTIVGPVPVVSYPRVYVNMQGAFNNATNKVAIPTAGTYFIDLTIRMRSSTTNGNEGLS